MGSCREGPRGALLLSRPRPELGAPGLCSQCGLCHMPPDSTQLATKCRLLGSSYQGGPGQSEVALACTGTHLKKPRTNTLGGWLQNTTEHHLIDSTSGAPEVGLSSHQSTGAIPLSGARPGTAVCTLWSWPLLTATQPEGEPQPLKCRQQSRPTTTGGALLGRPAQVVSKTVPLGPTGPLLSRVT